MCNLGSEGIGVGGVDEVHGASAKAAASHARAKDARAGRSEVDKEIKLPATYLVVIAQTGMGAIEQVAETIGILRFQRVDGSENSLIFGDDVAAAPINNGGKSMAEFFQINHANIAQGVNVWKKRVKYFDAGFTIRAAAIVFPRCQFVTNHAVTDDHAKIVGDSEELIFKGTAIDHQCVSRDPKAGDKGIHDADTRADILVLGGLAKFCEVEEGNVEIGKGDESQGDGDFEGGGRTKARTNRYLAMDEQVRAREVVSRLLQRFGDAADEVAPVISGRTIQRIQGKGNSFREMFGVHLDDPVGSSVGGDPGIEPNCHGHDEAIVVVRVFADQIDTAGRPEDLHTSSHAVEFSEARQQAIAGQVRIGDTGNHRRLPGMLIAAINETPHTGRRWWSGSVRQISFLMDGATVLIMPSRTLEWRPALEKHAGPRWRIRIRI